MVHRIEIKPIGTVLQTDEDGYLVSQSSADKIVEPWRTAVNDVADSCRRVLGENLHSVYVRGSASRGEAIEGISDLDTVVVRRSLTDKELQQLRIGRRELEQKYPFCTDIEINTHVYDELISGADRGFALLKIYATCVWGEDVIPQLPSIKPGREAIMHAGGFKRRIEERMKLYESGAKQLTRPRCTWVMKRLLRVGGEIIMEREQVFVRELYPCYALFSKYYPGKQAQMRQVLEYALNPVDDLAEVCELIEDMTSFLSQEAQKVLVES